MAYDPDIDPILDAIRQAQQETAAALTAAEARIAALELSLIHI